MKYKKNLVWKAFRYGLNGLECFNIISNDLIEDIKTANRKKELKNINDLRKIIKSWAMHHYWGRAEHEVIIGDLFGKTEEKIDVYWQIDMNLDRLCEYIAREMKLFDKQGGLKDVEGETE